MKPLIIGEAPSKNEVTPRPLEGRVGKRLAALCGLTLDEYLKHFDRVNLLDVRQDTKEKGFEFDHKLARVKAEYMLEFDIEPNRIVLLLGWRVAKAFNLDHLGYFEEQRHPDSSAEFRVLPHPSGVNRWWNDIRHLMDAEVFMKTIVERTR